MAQKITVQVTGGASQVLENIGTVGDVKARLGKQNYQATVNGEPASDSDTLDDYSFVALTEKVKGAN